MPIKKILIVDDSATDRQFLLEVLSKQGYQCVTAQSGKAAEYAGDDDAAEEKNLDRGSRVTENETPSEPGCDEAVVQALIRGERLRSPGEIGRCAESAKAQGPGPEEHLEYEEPEMQDGDQCYRGIGDGCHVTPFLDSRVASRSCDRATM